MLDILLLKDKLKKRLSKPLNNPQKSHAKMMPETVNHFINKLKHNENPRKSSVLIVLCEYNDNISIVLTRRSIDKRSKHSGQICFPGGKQEPTDKDNMETAIREAVEEIGLQKDKIEVLGELSELYIPVSNFIVYPFVAYYYGNLKLNPDPKEVDEIIFADFKDIINKENISQTSMNIDNFDFNIPYFDVKQNIVWGATAMIMSELIDIYNEIV